MMKLLCFMFHSHIAVHIIFLLSSPAAATAPKYVVPLRGKPDGRTDISDDFSQAWRLACMSRTEAEIRVPRESFMIAKPLELTGPCNRHVTVNILGTLVAPFDYNVLGYSKSWISFSHVDGLSIINGVLNARGAGLWDCKVNLPNCPAGATSLDITACQNINIDGLTSLDSQLGHIAIHGSREVMVKNVNVRASGHSPNTDGIHLQKSTGVTILDTKIATGDDCVSIGAGTSNLWIERITCGPGHGISIGSLAKHFREEGVQKVTVKTATFISTTNGFRMKTWRRPSTAFVSDVLFEGGTMQDVHNPIIIDQNYCPHNENCPHGDSGVKISNVKYKNIYGASATSVGMKFSCSFAKPCENIQVQDVKLTYKGRLAQTLCAYATVNSDPSVSSCFYKKAK